MYPCMNIHFSIVIIIDHVEQNAKDFKKSAENVNRAECCKTYKVSI